MSCHLTFLFRLRLILLQAFTYHKHMWLFIWNTRYRITLQPDKLMDMRIMDTTWLVRTVVPILITDILSNITLNWECNGIIATMLNGELRIHIGWNLFLLFCKLHTYSKLFNFVLDSSFQWAHLLVTSQIKVCWRFGILDAPIIYW